MINIIKDMKQIFGRVGGKNLLKNKIVDNYFPENYEDMIYVEPFVGGGSIFFYKKPSKKEIINDIDEGVIDIFKLFKNYDGKDIEKLINRPWNKEDFKEVLDFKPTNDFERGVRELILMKTSFFSMKKYYSKPRRLINASYGDKYKKRLKDTVILNQDFKKVIKKYDSENTFFYLDPPYENSKGLYENFDISIQDLYDILKNIKGKFLLSYNDSEEAKKLFKNYNINIIHTKYTNPRIGSQTRKINELLISNF